MVTPEKKIVLTLPARHGPDIIGMILEQNNRDKIRARLIRRLRLNYEIEVGLINTIGNYWAGDVDD